MIRQDFNKGWQFQLKGGEKTGVDLPHDFSIIQERSADSPAGWGNGYFPGGVGDYEKTVFIPDDWKDKKVMLEFEGVYMNATVHVNDNLAARHPYGYTTFHCDMSPWLKFGKENKISVHVNNSAQPNCRWYSGSGIYRPVWLMVADRLYVKPFGLKVSTPEISADQAMVEVEAEIVHEGKKQYGSVEMHTIIRDPEGNTVCEGKMPTSVKPDGATNVKHTFFIKKPHLWSDKDPYLYTVAVTVVGDGTITDKAVTTAGIRKIEFIPGIGFLLNGAKTYLKGGDVHHDHGPIGACAFNDAEDRKVRNLKKNGFNAVRCSHNPPSPAFLDACDRYGVLVMDEAFDGWRESKLENDYSLFFDEWWQRDLSSMVLRDYNHPSVIMWSTGNEVNERDGRSDACKTAKMLVDFVKSLDHTRPVTHGINEKVKVPEKFKDCHDIISYNYESKDYEVECREHPERMILASENYLFDTFEYWMNCEKYPNVIGDFYWTAVDYFGESGLGMPRYIKGDMIPVYPWHQSFNSDIDICGFKRPQSFYRDCVWGLAAKPWIAVYRPQFYKWETGIAGWTWHDVIHSWSWPGFEEKPVMVEVYSVDEEVELFLNGTSLGKKPAGRENKYIATFDITYEPGELKAVSYSGGKKTAEDVLYTAGKAASIRLRAEKPEVNAVSAADCDGLTPRTDSLVYVVAELLDEKGNIIPTARDKVYFTVCGEGSLIAVGSSDPKSEEMYVGNSRSLYEGRALAVIRLDGSSGKVAVNAMVDGIPSASCTINIA